VAVAESAPQADSGICVCYLYSSRTTFQLIKSIVWVSRSSLLFTSATAKTFEWCSQCKNGTNKQKQRVIVAVYHSIKQSKTASSKILLETTTAEVLVTLW